MSQQNSTSYLRAARDLADDVRRFLNNEPITARPPSRSYLVRKFVSRNRALVGGTLATIVALVAGMVLYANEARLARVEAAKSLYEAEKARTINNFIANDFLSTLLVDDVVDRANLARFVGHATENVSAMFGDQPALEAAVRNEVGTIYLTTGHYDLAVDEYSLALQLWTDELGREHSDTLKAVNNLGQTYARLGKADLAEPLYRRALDGRQKALGVTHSYTLASMNNLAELLRATGRMNEAEKLMRRALKLQRQEYGADDKHALIMTANLASLLAVRGQHEEAARMRQAVVNTMMDTLGRNHITTMHAKFELAKSLYSMKDYDAAQQILGPPIDTFDRISGAASFDTIKARRLMSRIQRKRGDINAARIELQKAIDAAETDPEKFAEVILLMVARYYSTYELFVILTRILAELA